MRVHELVDRFDAGGNPLLTYNAGAAVAGGHLTLTMLTGGAVASRDYLDLTRSRLVVELVTVPVTSRSRVAVTLTGDQVSGSALWWSIAAGQLAAFRNVDGVNTTGWSAPYDAGAHRWLSIRHEGDSVVWATSSDGLEWIDRAQLLTGMPVTAMRVTLSGGLAPLDPPTDDGLTAGPLVLDNLGAPPTPDADPVTSIVTDGNAPGIAVDVLPATGELGTFVVTESEVDGAMLLGWGDNLAEWLNIVCDVTRVNVRRGATNALGPMPRTEAGTCTLTLIDRERRFDPTLNADAIHPRTPVRVRAYGTRPALELVELRRNLVPNPSTVSSPAPYAANAATLSIVAGWLRASVTTLATSGPGVAYVNPRRGVVDDEFGRFAAVPGQRVASRVEVHNPNASAITVRLDLVRYAYSGGAYSGAGSTTGGWVTLAAGASTTLETLATVPAGTTTHVLPIVYLAGVTSAVAPASAGILYEFTRWALWVGAAAPAAGPVPYFDGDTAATGSGVGEVSYAWAGTTRASASVEFGRTAIVEPWSAVLFTGRIDGDGIVVRYEQTGPPTVTISASDLIGSLNRWEAAGRDEPGVGSGDSLLTRVHRVLDETGLGDTALALDNDPTYAATLAPTVLDNGWEPIAAAAEAELGRVWVTAGNRLAVRARGSELAGPVRGTLSDWHDETVDDDGLHCCYSEPVVRYSPGSIVNRAIGGRRGGTVLEQLDDESSQARFAVSAYRDTSLELADDGQLYPWAIALLAGQTEPRVRVDSVRPMPRTAPEAWPAVAETDVGDRWHFRYHPEVGPTVRQAVGVLGIEHDIDPTGWDTTWHTVRAPTPGVADLGWFTLDVSYVGDGDLLAPFV